MLLRRVTNEFLIFLHTTVTELLEKCRRLKYAVAVEELIFDKNESVNAEIISVLFHIGCMNVTERNQTVATEKTEILQLISIWLTALPKVALRRK